MVVYLDSGYMEIIASFISRVGGVTTNPSLFKAAVIKNYRELAESILERVNGKPVSFEVFADDPEGMEFQARKIASWGENVYVKIPVTNTKGESTAPLIRKLGIDGIKLNVTAVFTFNQISTVCRCLSGPSILSIFCGRIADTGIDPSPFITHAVRVKHADTKILWASTREVYNYRQAQQAGADIITMPPDLISKLPLLWKDLAQYSLETVKQFYEDGQGITL